MELGKELGKVEHEIEEFIKEEGKKIHHAATAIEHRIEAVTGHLSTMTDYPHSDSKAKVRIGNGLCDGERSYLEKRKPKVCSALEALLKCDLKGKKIPIVAMIGSGGGYRAMQCTGGSIFGAKQQQIDLLDTITYLTGLSGSTWFIIPWYSTGMPLQEFEQYLIQCASREFIDLTQHEAELVANYVAFKKHHNQKRTLVDPYGELLANRLLVHLGEKRHKTTLSQQTTFIQNGDVPYPICAAIDGRKKEIDNPDDYEITPHEFGSPQINAYIPTPAIGHKYKNGMSKKVKPEQNVGFIMGTCGSAFAADWDLIFKKFKKHDILEKILLEYEHMRDLKGTRPLPFHGKISNFTYKMPQQTLTKLKYLKLVDAGLKANLPYPPVSGVRPERKADILIFLDSSAGHVGNQLKKAQEYARLNKLPFPKIDYTDIEKKTISVFKDEVDKSVPVVIYMPRISDQQLWEANKSKTEFENFGLDGFDLNQETEKGFCETIHFHYTKENAKKVINQTKFNMMINKGIILNAINWWIDHQNS